MKMNSAIIWLTLGILRLSIAANLDTCSETQVSYNYRFGLGCYEKTITCNNITRDLMLNKVHCNNPHCNALIVRNSNLSSVDSKFLSSNFCSLLIITLSNCQIEIITKDAFSGFSKTEQLNLEHNKIKNLKFLDYLTKLKNLNLMDNELTQIGAEDFRNLPNLEILNVAHNNLISIGNSTFMLNNLQELYLNNNNIVKVQKMVFQKLTKLTTLNLGANKIELISEGIFDNLINLKNLYLQQNRIKSIAAYSFNKLTSLDTLDLSSNMFLNEIVDNTIVGCRNLHNLNLSYSNISSIGAQDFSKAILIKKLDLSHNNLRYLSISQEIDQLYLQNNPLTLQSNSTSVKVVEFLDLSGCNLTVLHEHFLAINQLKRLKLTNTNLSIIEASAFKYLNLREQLDLSRNKIEILPSYAFAGLPFLQMLDLSHNPIKIISEYAFSSLGKLSNLRITGNSLTIRNNSFSEMPNLQYLNFIDSKQLSLESTGFYQSNNLKFINSSIRNLGKDFFYGISSAPEFSLCNHKKEEKSLRLCNVSLQSIDSNAFQGSWISFSNYDFSYNNLTNITANTFQNIKDTDLLELNNNDIHFIDSFAFHNISFCNKIHIPYNYHYRYTNANCNNKSIYLNDMKNLQVISQNAFSKIYNLKSLHLERSNVTKIESFAFDTITFNSVDGCQGLLYLNFNNISTIGKNTFSNISGITELYLDHSKIKNIESNAFASVQFCNIKTKSVIFLNDNLLDTLETDTFNGISNLNELHLENNQIKTIQKLAFNGLRMSQSQKMNAILIILTGNRINKLIEGTFDGILNLEKLLINSNQITVIEPKTFGPLKDLLFLDLSLNNLSAISPNMFISNPIQTLNLSHNKINLLTTESFTGLDRLKDLIMAQNLIENIPLGTLKNFPLLERLELGENRLSKFKVGTFSNLATLNYLDLSHNKFEILDESILYPLHRLGSLMLNNNMLSSINSTSLLEHLPTLRYISLHCNHWNCKLLLNMLKSFQFGHVNYLPRDTHKYNEENVEGIACSETEGGMQEYTTQDSIQQIHSHDLHDLINTFSKLINNSDNNSKKLISEVQKILNETKINGYSHVDLITSVETLIRDIRVTNSVEKNELAIKNNSELLRQLINVTKEQNYDKNFDNTNEMLKLLLDSNQQSLNYTLHDFQIHKSSEKLTDNPQNNFPNYTFPLYLIMLVCIGIFCLLGFNMYRKYFKSALNRNQNQRSELELINSD